MSTGKANMTTQTDKTAILNLIQFVRKFSLYLRKNPATSFILAFEALLLVAAVEMIDGNIAGANAVGVYAFVALVMGVALHAISVIKGSKEGKTSP